MKAGIAFLAALSLLVSFNSGWAQLGQMDTLYVVPVNTTLPPSGPGEVELQFRFKTDNLAGWMIFAYAIVARYSINNPGASIGFQADTNYIFNHTISESLNWPIRSVQDLPDNDTTGRFVLGTVTFGSGFHAGDYSVANVRFMLSDTATLIVDTTSFGASFTDFIGPHPIVIPVSWKPGGYSFQITRQPPAVPALSRFGLVLFGLLILSGLVYFLRSHRFTISGKETKDNSPG